MSDTYKVIFDGTFNPDLQPQEIRKRLLKVYKGRNDIVDRFFTLRKLIIKRGVDYESARRYKAILENTGTLCRIEKETLPRAGGESDLTGRSPSAKEVPGSAYDAGPLQAPAGKDSADTAKPEKGPSRFRPHKAGPAKPDRVPVLRGSKLQNIIAAVMILMIIISVGIRIWALNEARGIHPPDNVTSNGTQVCLHYNGTLFFLTPEGKLQKKVPLIDLGITGKPADLQLLNNGDLIVGDRFEGKIMLCDVSGLSCREIGPADDYSVDNTFKFLADEGRGLLFIADTNNHAILVQDLEGSFIRRAETSSNIDYPNDMALDGQGRLWLSNTLHSTLVAFTVRENGISQTGTSINLRPRIPGAVGLTPAPGDDDEGKEPGIKDLYEKLKKIREEKEKLGDDFIQTRPLALAWDSEGDLWVVASNRGITTAGVRVFSPDGEQIGRVPLGDEAIPVDIALAGDRMLITDRGRFEVLSVDITRGSAAAFGDQEFNTELTRVRSALRKYKEIKSWAGRGIVMLVIGTVILVAVILLRNVKTRSSLTVPAPAGRGKGWEVLRSEKSQAGIEVRGYRLEFTGTGSEYFRIWIVNTFLTILTLGVYAAWAKVRTRQYFYRNLFLGGYSFDYTADPKAILKGYAIVGAGISAYYLSEAFNPVLSLIIFAVFSLFIPFLIYKSLRFFAYNSVFRNIRLRFIGSLGESYRAYLFYPLLIPFTLGLIVPYWAYARKRYFFNNLGFGATVNSFHGNHGPFYQVYILLGMALAGIVMTLIFVTGAITAAFAALSSDGGAAGAGIIVMIAIIYGSILIVSTFFQQFIYAWELNYCLKHSTLGEVRFKSTLNGGKLFWIRLSNIFAIIFSMGLLIPWAKVRRMRYIADNISLVTTLDLSDFTAAVGVDESAYGDAATDFFDFEIGL